MPRGRMRGSRPRDHNSQTRSGLYTVNSQHDAQLNNEWSSFPGELSTNPATSASQIYLYSQTDGEYYIQPSASQTTRKVYVNFSQSTVSGKGLTLVAVGRNGDWWNNSGTNQNNMIASNTGSNTVAYLQSSWIDALIGDWNDLHMVINRRLYGDSLRLTGDQNGTFYWSTFNSSNTGYSATYKRYTGLWNAGSNSWTETGSGWGDSGPNNCERSFTWTWSGHGGTEGWAHGNGCTFSGGYSYGGNTHSLDRVNVYVYS